MNKIFRIDDIGSSTKHFNQHGKKWFNIFGKKIIYFPFANFWFLKTFEPFRGWAKYEELTVGEWKEILNIFEENKIVPIIAITATWVDEKSNLIPYPEKFPEESKFLKEAYLNGKIIIANHGLTHCVLGKQNPRFWSSNRKYWREFYSDFDESLHKDHILRSQKILEDFFEKPIEIFVPPGNVWSLKTYDAILQTNIKQVMASRPPMDGAIPKGTIIFHQDDGGVFAFHDRELKLYGNSWLEEKIKEFKK